MRHRVPIYALAVALTAIAWALRIEHPLISYVVVGCAVLIAVLALFERADPDSAGALRRRMRRLAKLARTMTPDKFFAEHYHDMSGVRMLVADKYGIHPRNDMYSFLTAHPRSEKDMTNIAACLEEMASRLKSA